jgi:hypothetical protein
LIAVIILVILIVLFIFFIIIYFDSSDNELNFNDIKKLKLITKENILSTLKDYKTTIISNKGEFIEKTKNLKVLFLKPIELKNSINFKEVYDTTIEDMKSFFEILMNPPYNYRLLIV